MIRNDRLRLRSWSMVGRRKYDEGCAVSHALDLIGERWALLVVRELLLGPKRFTDLRKGIPGASPDVLAQRLRELTESGVVRQSKLPPPAASQVYVLTEWGAELEPVVTQLGRWGARSPSLDPMGDGSADSLVLSLRALFDQRAAQGFDETIVLRLGEDHFTVRVVDGELILTRGVAERPSATLETDRPTLASLLYGGRRLDEAVTTGDAAIAGQATAMKRFLSLFRLPEPAGRP
jgi:DNA-binding HxlR family transcriptional regulator